jgi:hypothetical protein
VHGIWFYVESASSELAKVAMEKTKLQHDYTIALQEKSMVEEKDERILKEKSEAKEKQREY